MAFKFYPELLVSTERSIPIGLETYFGSGSLIAQKTERKTTTRSLASDRCFLVHNNCVMSLEPRCHLASLKRSRAI
jgi:hypothetical protein